MTAVNDPYKLLVVCQGCKEYYCTPCDMHWADCPCHGPHDSKEDDE